MRRMSSAAAAGEHRPQHIVMADKMVEKRRRRMQSNQRQEQVGDKLVRRHRLFGQHLVGADHRRQLAVGSAKLTKGRG